MICLLKKAFGVFQDEDFMNSYHIRYTVSLLTYTCLCIYICFIVIFCIVYFYNKLSYLFVTFPCLFVCLFGTTERYVIL